MLSTPAVQSTETRVFRTGRNDISQLSMLKLAERLFHRRRQLKTEFHASTGNDRHVQLGRKLTRSTLSALPPPLASRHPADQDRLEAARTKPAQTLKLLKRPQ